MKNKMYMHAFQSTFITGTLRVNFNGSPTFDLSILVLCLVQFVSNSMG